jgi:hypothetical protein
MIQVTTTAMARADILNRTLKSFRKNIIDWDDYFNTIIINVDPLPENIDRNECLDVCRKYFENVIYQLPDDANFTRALKWTWETASSEFILNLQDDWILISKISINKLLKTIGKNNQYRLRTPANNNTSKKYSLSPSLLRKVWYKKAASLFDIYKNPEIQLRVPELHDELVIQTNQVLVNDIGREWLKTTKYRKPDTKTEFYTWILK